MLSSGAGSATYLEYLISFIKAHGLQFPVFSRKFAAFPAADVVPALSGPEAGTASPAANCELFSVKRTSLEHGRLFASSVFHPLGALFPRRENAFLVAP